MTHRREDDPLVRVGIGLIERAGFYLARIRPERAGSPMPGVWEFPGGKCEGEESPEQATERECREEVGMSVSVGNHRKTIRHRYPHGLVEIHYFDCRPAEHDSQPAADSGFLWLLGRDLAKLTFPEANEPILHELAKRP